MFIGLGVAALYWMMCGDRQDHWKGNNLGPEIRLIGSNGNHHWLYLMPNKVLNKPILDKSTTILGPVLLPPFSRVPVRIRNIVIIGAS